MTSRHVFEGTQFNDYTLNYDAENRLVSVTGAATASFVYDGDSKQIKATVNGITAVYVGNHYEVKNSIVTKYYFAGSTRIAVRKDGTLSFLLSDHLGSSSVTTNANGAKTASALYKAFGETRYTLGSLGTDYKFTGQREEASLGIYFFQARWFDPSLGRFLSPDTIVPTSTQGTQAWDRYAFVNNNPVRYNDPTGHWGCEEDEYCPDEEGTTPPPPPPTCTTVTCEALNGNVGAIIDFLIPSHIGFRWQLEVSGSIGGIIGIGPSGTLGLNVAYNRKSEEFAAFADLTGEGGVGAGSPLGASVTTGPLVGWGSSTVSDVATGDSAVLSGTVAPDLAVSFSGSAPLEGYSVSDPLNFENANLHVDPVYGQVPATLYGGGGFGGYYAGGGGGISHVFASAIIDLSPLFPWNW
ncbi:MAG: RHS repeat-associated core domain-containing protein [Anaerolineales bacterium]|nr:MAG: RHS repeat-associated core domain-containing protein [Anaerolineales bacterium]